MRLKIATVVFAFIVFCSHAAMAREVKLLTSLMCRLWVTTVMYALGFIRLRTDTVLKFWLF